MDKAKYIINEYTKELNKLVREYKVMANVDVVKLKLDENKTK